MGFFARYQSYKRERYIHHLGHFVGKLIHCSKQCWRISIEGATKEVDCLTFRSRRTAQAYAMKWLQVNHKVKTSYTSIEMDPMDFHPMNMEQAAARLLRKEK